MSELPTPKEPKSNNYSIERAVPKDAKGIADVQVDTWIDTYVNDKLDITEEAIRERFFDEDGKIFEDKIKRGENKIANSPYGVFVAKDGDKIVGFSSPYYDESNDQQRLGGLYVLPEAQGHGLGKKLLHKALDALDTTQDIYLHVVTYNEKAIAFYEKNGFVRTGEEVTGSVSPLPNGVVIPEIEMKLPAKQ